MLIDRIDVKEKGLKRMLKKERRQVKCAMGRIVTCFGNRVTDADRCTLARVFAVEENALQFCEDGCVSKAISLLKEQEGPMACMAIAILERTALSCV